MSRVALLEKAALTCWAGGARMKDLLVRLRELLSKYDSSTQPISEAEIYTAIRRLRDREDQVPPPVEWLAEVMAFGFHESCRDKETGCGTYFGPMATWTERDGTIGEFPSVKDVTPDMIRYWTDRAKQAKHPIMRARYADLVWELTEIVTGNSRDFRMAQVAVDSYIEIARSDCHKYQTDVIDKLKRALSLALLLNDQSRVASVRDAIIEYEDYVAENDKPGLWGFSYDFLYNNKKVALSEDQKRKLVLDLESRLERLSGSEQAPSPDPWAAEAAALRLANHYRDLGRHEDVRRVLLKLGACFERVSEGASPLLASIWLQRVYSVYLQYGLRPDAERIAVKLRKLGPQVADDMKTLSHSLTVPKEEMERYVEGMVEGSLNSALGRIAAHFVPRRRDVEDQLDELSRKAPLSFLVTRQLQDYRGRPVATIGSIDADRVGHLIHQMSQNMRISSVFLREVMSSLSTKFAHALEQLVDYIFQAPIFDERRKEIIRAGIRAYLGGDYLVAIHLLIPQIEDAIRNLLEMSGASVLKASRRGGLDLKLLDELLRDPVIDEVFGEDIALYFRVLLTDPRGWNLRNDVCHGLLPIEAFQAYVADRVIHVLLCLAQVRRAEVVQE